MKRRNPANPRTPSPKVLWNDGLCYRCNKEPQWRGYAWCLKCSIGGAEQMLHDPYYSPRALAELTATYGRFTEFPKDLLKQMRDKINRTNNGMPDQSPWTT